MEFGFMQPKTYLFIYILTAFVKIVFSVNTERLGISCLLWIFFHYTKEPYYELYIKLV